MAHPLITVSAVVLRDTSGRVLTVRKRGTRRFMLPGGKPESGETPAETGARETREEVGVDLGADELSLLGTFRAPAANEADHEVEGVVFCGPLTGEPSAAAEIEELRWLDPTGDLPGDIAPLLASCVVPALLSRTAG